MKHFTISAKGKNRGESRFEHMGLEYTLTIMFNERDEEILIYADNRQRAIEMGKIIVTATTPKEAWAMAEHQNALQQLAKAYRMLEDESKDQDKVIDYIKRLKAHFNLVDDVVIEKKTEISNEENNIETQSDFDPSSIVSNDPSEPLKLNLQHFASAPNVTPKQRTIHDSHYDNVKIITTQGEYIARIHPSQYNDTQHEIFFSSDDSFIVNDIDIISVTPMYKKSITVDGVQKWGIGKGLSLIYTIETTKNDIEVDDINYSNIHKQQCKNIQSALEYINHCQRQGWHNIAIITEVEHKDNTIISDASDCNIELYINNEEWDSLKRNNRELREYNDSLEKELEQYKAFMQKYKAEKTFENFKEENKNNIES